MLEVVVLRILDEGGGVGKESSRGRVGVGRFRDGGVSFVVV